MFPTGKRFQFGCKSVLWTSLSITSSSIVPRGTMALLILVLPWYLQTLGELTQIPSNLIFIQRYPRISLFSVPGSPWL